MKQNYILEITNLNKSFSHKKVLDDLCLSVPQGSVFGFVGKNGAGKTTTMKLILGLLKADSGIIKVQGDNVVFGNTSTNKYIGYLPDVPAFYNYMTAKEYLQFCSKLLSKNSYENLAHIDDLLNKVGLDSTKQRIGGYSRGMKQRLGIAQALIGKPKLLICDEPTSALDPIGRKEILDVLLTIKEETTVLFSTHILNDIQAICNHIGILHNGKIALSGNINEIENNNMNNKIYISFAHNEDAQKCLNILQKTYTVTLDGNKITCQTNDISADSLKLMYILYTNNIAPIEYSAKSKTLEEIFMEVC